MFLTGVSDLDLVSDMVTDLWYTKVLSFDYLEFDGAKNIHVL